jgi:hypothetical protein
MSAVEHRHAEVERPVDRRDRDVVVAVGVEVAHPHAAEALSPDDQSLSQGAVLHGAASASPRPV